MTKPNSDPGVTAGTEWKALQSSLHEIGKYLEWYDTEALLGHDEPIYTALHLVFNYLNDGRHVFDRAEHLLDLHNGHDKPTADRIGAGAALYYDHICQRLNDALAKPDLADPARHLGEANLDYLRLHRDALLAEAMIKIVTFGPRFDQLRRADLVDLPDIISGPSL